MRYIVKILAVLLALATLSGSLSLGVEAREAVASDANRASAVTAETDMPARWSRDGSLVVQAAPTAGSPAHRADTGSVPLLSEAGWTTIVGEDFEGSATLAGWEVEDGNGPISGEYYWAKRNCRPHAGSYSGWAVGGGADGAALGCGSDYPEDTMSWMIYGPFSLADATAGELRFQLWLNSESLYDRVFWGASIDGVQFYGDAETGNTLGWVEKVLDLTDVFTLGDLTGEADVWIALVFISDYTITQPEGAYVDDILLRAYNADFPDQPDVNIVQQISGSDFAPGDPITFTLSIANTGNVVASSVVVTDIIPSQILTPIYTSTLPITLTGDSLYVWDVGVLDVGQSGVITVCGQIDPGLADGTSFPNTATIFAPGDITPGNNTSQVVVNGEDYMVYLPVVIKRWPPLPETPELYAISNQDGDGFYDVNWGTAYLADTYTLEEDDNPAFASPTTVYNGGLTSWSATGGLGGTYYYRVKASNSWGDSGWSNTQSVDVSSRAYTDADADVVQGFPNVNYGGDSRMWTGYDYATCHPGTPSGEVSRALMHFDLSGIPAGKTISQARLYFHVVGACAYNASGSARTITARRVKGSWSESSVTWGTQPGYAESYGSTSIPLSEPLGWYSLDVTNLVRGWANGSVSNNGLALIGPEGTSNGCVRFSIATREWGAYAPYLSIIYDETAVQDQFPAAGETPYPTECETVADGTVICSLVESLERSRRLSLAQ